jgi:O-phosphoseryl-tRNA(Cys) synthetase
MNEETVMRYRQIFAAFNGDPAADSVLRQLAVLLDLSDAELDRVCEPVWDDLKRQTPETVGEFLYSRLCCGAFTQALEDAIPAPTTTNALRRAFATGLVRRAFELTKTA